MGCAGKGNVDPQMAGFVKQLKQSFYSAGPYSKPDRHRSSPAGKVVDVLRSELAQPRCAHRPHLALGGCAGDLEDEQGTSLDASSSACWPGGARLPLFVNDAVPTMPFSQRLLHVHLPLYAHMFEEIFTRPRPWVFGLVSVKGGLKALCSEGGAPRAPEEVVQQQQGEAAAAPAAAAAQSHAARVGVVMEVDRAVRLNTGALMILATSVSRFEVRGLITMRSCTH